MTPTSCSSSVRAPRHGASRRSTSIKEAVDRLSGRFAADVRDCEAVHRSILEMADMLSDGIVAQFPERFR